MRFVFAFLSCLGAASFLLSNVALAQTRGTAAYYAHPGRTASGEVFQPSGMTAAHRTLPFGTRVRVTNTHNGRTVIVRINDRGPFTRGRIIDLSRGAAEVIGMTGRGIATVQLEVLR
jgi:rare lipoprotein A